MTTTSSASSSHSTEVRVELPPPEPLTASAKGLSERIIERLLQVCGGVSLVTTGLLGITLLVETLRFFGDVSPLAFFGDLSWSPRVANPRFGVWPLVSGTLLTTIIAMIVAAPAGVLAALYLSEFASPLLRRVLKPALEVLAGVPTIVFGYFALVVVTPSLQSVVANLSGFNALSAGLVIGIMLTPMIFALSETAISAVPRGVREAAYALGADRLTTIFRVVLPAASRGVGAAVLLALGRALGETMIVAIAAGHQARITADPRVPIETMTAHVLQVAASGTPSDSPEHRAIFAVGMLLFLLTMAINVAAYRLRRRLRTTAVPTEVPT